MATEGQAHEMRVAQGLSNLTAMLRFNLLTYSALWAWLDDPYGVPIREPDAI